MNFIQLPLNGIERREVLLQRDDLPEIGIGLLADLGFGLPHLELPDLFAQPGQFVSVDDLQSGEHGLHGRDAAERAALDHRDREIHRPHLGDRHPEIGLYQPVLGLEDAARSGDLREVVREGFTPGLECGFQIKPAVLQRAVVLRGSLAARFERQRPGRSRDGAQQARPEEQIYERSFHHL